MYRPRDPHRVTSPPKSSSILNEDLARALVGSVMFKIHHPGLGWLAFGIPLDNLRKMHAKIGTFVAWVEHRTTGQGAPTGAMGRTRHLAHTLASKFENLFLRIVDPPGKHRFHVFHNLVKTLGADGRK